MGRGSSSNILQEAVRNERKHTSGSRLQITPQLRVRTFLSTRRRCLQYFDLHHLAARLQFMIHPAPARHARDDMRRLCDDLIEPDDGHEVASIALYYLHGQTRRVYPAVAPAEPAQFSAGAEIIGKLHVMFSNCTAQRMRTLPDSATSLLIVKTPAAAQRTVSRAPSGPGALPPELGFSCTPGPTPSSMTVSLPAPGAAPVPCLRLVWYCENSACSTLPSPFLSSDENLRCCFSASSLVMTPSPLRSTSLNAWPRMAPPSSMAPDGAPRAAALDRAEKPANKIVIATVFFIALLLQISHFGVHSQCQR